MKILYSIAENPSPPLLVALKALWFLHADPSYDVRKKLDGIDEIIALKTVSGSGRVLIEGDHEFNVLPGTLLFFKHSMVRRYYCSSEKWEFRWYEFNCEAGTYFPLNSIMEVEEIENEEWVNGECLRLLEVGSHVGNAAASSFFSILMNQWLIQNIKAHHVVPYEKDINKILLTVNTRLAENVSVKEMAGEAGLCERRFNDVFKQVMGISPGKYLDCIKIRRAEELLANTSLTISEIANRLGYSSPYHFSGSFKKHKKISPSTYRKNSGML